MAFSEEAVLSSEEIADIAADLQALPITPNLGRGSGRALARGMARVIKSSTDDDIEAVSDYMSGLAAP